MISVTVTFLAWDIPQIVLQSINNTNTSAWDWLRVEKCCWGVICGAACSFISSYLRIINILNYRYFTKTIF
jgi:hypothetical protein